MTITAFCDSVISY